MVMYTSTKIGAIINPYFQFEGQSLKEDLNIQLNIPRIKNIKEKYITSTVIALRLSNFIAEIDIFIAECFESELVENKTIFVCNRKLHPISPVYSIVCILFWEQGNHCWPGIFCHPEFSSGSGIKSPQDPETSSA